MSSIISQKNRIWVFILKSIAVLSRYIFLLVFGKLLLIKDFANFNLITSLGTYILYFIGIDYYIYLHRSYNVNKDLFLNYVKKYMSIIFFSFSVSVPFLIFFLKELNLPTYLLFLICLIPLLELIIQEAYRFEVIKGKQKFANILLIIRYIWMLPCSLFLFYFPNKENLNNIIYFWLFVNFLICIYILLKIYKVQRFKSIDSINFNEIIEDLKKLAPVFLSTISLRAFFFLDKWIPQFLNVKPEIIANYAFCSLFGAGLATFYDAIFISHYYPTLLATVDSDKHRFKEIISLFAKEMSLISLAVTLLLVFVAPFINFHWGALTITGTLVIGCVLAQIIYNIALVPHYVLFTLKKDREVLISNFSGLLSFICIIFVLGNSPISFIYSILIAVNVGFLVIFLLKTHYLRKNGYKLYK